MSLHESSTTNVHIQNIWECLFDPKVTDTHVQEQDYKQHICSIGWLRGGRKPSLWRAASQVWMIASEPIPACAKSNPQPASVDLDFLVVSSTPGLWHAHRAPTNDWISV
jgi:hypothetical protein